MPQEVLTPLLLFVAGFASGTLNAIAGGGSLLTLPLMIFLGLPPTVANGTNRVAVLIQGVGATWGFGRRGLISRPWLALSVPPSLVGAALGTWGAVRIGDLAFQRVLAVILVLVAAWTLWQPSLAADAGDAPPPAGKRRVLFQVVFFLIGVYGGFVQAGVGFVILAATSAGGLDLLRGNATKMALVMSFTVLSLALFALNGRVDWVMGLMLAAGTFSGALLGVHLQVLKGQQWVRGVVTVTVVVFAIQLLLRG